MKTLFYLLFALLLSVPAAAQQSFLNTLQHEGYGRALRILPGQDDGWVIFSLDSLKMTSFNSCGHPQWSRNFDLPGMAFVNGMADVLRTPDGGYAFLSRYENNNQEVPVLTRIDANGTILWSRTYQDPDYRHFTYTLNQDQDGNLLLFGNVEHRLASPFYNMLCKISPSGNVLWTKLYNHGGIWGGSIVTSDKGILARTGSTFIKTDANGNVQWTARVSFLSDYYFAPVEVADGYIFTAQDVPSGITFFKLSKQGNMLWGGGKTTNLTGQPNRLRARPNGNLVLMTDQFVNGAYSVALTEFDKDLNVLHHKALASPQGTKDFVSGDVCLLPDGRALLTGRALEAGTEQVFYARTNPDLTLTCDTMLPPVTVTAAPATHLFISTSPIDFSLAHQSSGLTGSTFSAQQTAVCGAPPVLTLDLAPDTTICQGTTLSLQNLTGSGPFDSYTWSTGATTATIQVTEPGTYWLRATYGCNTLEVSDSITIAVNTVPVPALLSDTSLCASATVLLDATVAGATFAWNDGSTQPTLLVADAGEYWVDISANGCTRRFTATVADCELLLMPNVFTPNGDEHNEAFLPMQMRGIEKATLSVHNRWGQQIYSTQDVSGTGWNGRTGNSLVPAGVYFWTIRYTNFLQQEKEVRGFVELLN